MSDGDGISRRRLLQLGLGAAAGSALLESGPAQAAQGEAALPQVPRRRLGKTGMDVPILLMGGSMQFDQRFDPKLAECLRFGVNYFDTADCYAGGTSETAIGNFLERTKKRDAVWITTKSDRWEPQGLEETLKTGLSRLKTDHVDLYFLHQLDDEALISPETARVAEKLKKGPVMMLTVMPSEGSEAVVGRRDHVPLQLPAVRQQRTEPGNGRLLARRHRAHRDEDPVLRGGDRRRGP